MIGLSFPNEVDPSAFENLIIKRLEERKSRIQDRQNRRAGGAGGGGHHQRQGSTPVSGGASLAPAAAA
eukprot:Pgem_evm1s3021